MGAKAIVFIIIVENSNSKIIEVAAAVQVHTSVPNVQKLEHPSILNVQKSKIESNNQNIPEIQTQNFSIN